MTIILALFLDLFWRYISDNSIELDLLYEYPSWDLRDHCWLDHLKEQSTVLKVPFNVISLALLSVGVGCLQVLLDKEKSSVG